MTDSGRKRLEYGLPESAMDTGAKDEIDLANLWSILWQGKWLIGGITAFTTVVAIVIILLLPNFYRCEVAFPGRYPIDQDETPSSVPERAGCLTELASPQGGVITHEAPKRREREQPDVLSECLESETAIATAFETDKPESAAVRQPLLDQLNATVATGRLVIDLPQILSDSVNDETDVVLKDGDRLLIPQESQTVTIIGEVQYPISHIREPNISRDEFIEKSGGTTPNADEQRIYMVRADGAVVASTGPRLFRRRDARDIRPGDTIVGPLDVDRISELTLWTNASTVIYNIGVAAVAVASF